MITTLHLIATIGGLQRAEPVVGDGDSLLFLQDGLWAMRRDAPVLAALAARGCRLYALQDDLRARSLSAPDQVEATDDAGFVALIVGCKHNLSW